MQHCVWNMLTGTRENLNPPAAIFQMTFFLLCRPSVGGQLRKPFCDSITGTTGKKIFWEIRPQGWQGFNSGFQLIFRNLIELRISGLPTS